MEAKQTLVRATAEAKRWGKSGLAVASFAYLASTVAVAMAQEAPRKYQFEGAEQGRRPQLEASRLAARQESNLQRVIHVGHRPIPLESALVEAPHLLNAKIAVGAKTLIIGRSGRGGVLSNRRTGSLIDAATETYDLGVIFDTSYKPLATKIASIITRGGTHTTGIILLGTMIPCHFESYSTRLKDRDDYCLQAVDYLDDANPNDHELRGIDSVSDPLPSEADTRRAKWEEENKPLEADWIREKQRREESERRKSVAQ